MTRISTNTKIRREIAEILDILDDKEVKISDFDNSTTVHLKGIVSLSGRDLQDIAVAVDKPLSKLTFSFYGGEVDVRFKK